MIPRIRPLMFVVALVALVPATTAALAATSSYKNGAEIVSASVDRLEQGDDGTTFATISANGRYVAFQTRARNFFAADDLDPAGYYRVGGIFRKDLSTGAIELVADGDLKSSSDDSLVTRGAQNPSLSSDGRYVAFSTAQKLVPEDANLNVDVYVRDMTTPAHSPGAYELVSARDGGTVPASYAASRGFGSEVTRGKAISADGQRIVFKTRSASDLPAATSKSTTPSEQLFVRDRAAHSTTLVTLTNEPPAGQTELAPAGGADGGAAISGDGTTVVWAGHNAFWDPSSGEPGQTPFLNGENVFDRSDHYYFWRRVADGAAATTRRITGAVDLDDPACAPDTFYVPDPSATGPCYGPLNEREDWNRDLPLFDPPALSADGYRVAFLVNPPLRPNNQSGRELDLFLTDMRPGLSRKAATVELTRPGAQLDAAASSSITSAAITSDGRRIAFITQRTTYVLPSPRLVGDPALTPEQAEVYVLDLDAMEIERATHAWDGSEIDRPTLDGLTISDDGARVAFASDATNLFFGDGNEKPDAFVVSRAQPGAQDGAGPAGDLPFELPPPSTEKRRKPAPRISVRVKKTGGGNLSLAVRVTDAGRVEARAVSRVRSSSKRPRSGRAPLRTLATAGTDAQRAGEVTLVLRTKRYRTLLPKRRRLTARLLVSFAPRDGGRKVTARRNVALQPGRNRK